MNRHEIQLKKGVRPVYFKGAGEMNIKEVNLQSREVHIVLNAFGNKDDDKDIVQRGAFAKSIEERGPKSQTHRKVAYLKYHDMKMPIGTFSDLWETDENLQAVGRVDKTAEGDVTLEQYKSGTLNPHSIGFEYIWDKIDYSDAEDAFIVKELNLWEGSAVTLGVNENTPLLEMRGKNIDDIVSEANADLEKHLKGIEYKSQYDIRRTFARLLSLVEAKSKPSKDTLKGEKGEPKIEPVRWDVIAQAIKSQIKTETK